MSEQITLFDNISAETLEDILTDIVEQAKEKYGYHKMHVSGMYEMIKFAPSSELYNILELRKTKTGSICFYFDSQLYVRFEPKKEQVNMTKELYSVLLSGKPAEELKGSASPKGGAAIRLPYPEQVSFFKSALEYLIKTKKPANKFGCCSLYKKCSQAKRCLHENQFYAKGCFYRENLENGNIFYQDKNLLNL